MTKELINTSKEDKYGILILQTKILEIMDYIDLLCSEYGIDYCLMGGSALGAKRHAGFIPWDDDLDIFMTADNYEKFRDVFESKGDKENYYLQQLCFSKGKVSSAKLRANNTTYIEKETYDWDIHQGIFVDIFILHNCPNNPVLQLIQCLSAKYILIRGLGYKNYRRNGLRGIVIKLFKMLPDRLLIDKALYQVYKYNKKSTKYYCHFMGKAFYKEGIYPKEYFDSTKRINFENIKLSVPVKLEEYLSTRFGDYMKIPSDDDIKLSQHATKWSVTDEFKNFCGNINDFSDEVNLY